MIQIGPSSETGSDNQGLGFFSSSVYDEESGNFLGCVGFSKHWKSQTDDIGYHFARAFAALLGTFITFATLICLLVQCFNRHGKSCLWNFMKWSYLSAFLCQCACFIIWHSDLCGGDEDTDAKCSMGSDGIASIFNCVLLFGMVIATFNSSPPRNPVFRCWHATEDNFETDSDYSKEKEIEQKETAEDDVESQDPKIGVEAKNVAENSQRSSRSMRSMKSSRSVISARDDSSVSLFSSRSWLSNPQKLTVKQHARRLEKKGNLWPMNQLNPQWPSREYEGAPKKFVPIPANSNLEPFKSAAKISEWKKSQKAPEEPAIDTKSGLPKTGLVPASVADMYLKQLRARQQANGITETVATSKKTKEPKGIIKKVSSKESTQNGEVPETQSFELLGQSLESLAKSVILEEGGTRIEETLIGSTLKIVDVYPSVSGQSDSSISMLPGDVNFRTENLAAGRKTIMEEIRPDGSRVVTTLIDP